MIGPRGDLALPLTNEDGTPRPHLKAVAVGCSFHGEFDMVIAAPDLLQLTKAWCAITHLKTLDPKDTYPVDIYK